MSYCTQTDITNSGLSSATLIQLTDDAGTGAVNATVVAECIAQADAEIDGYLGARYSIPVSPVPVMLRNLSVAASVWKLYGHRGLDHARRRQDYEDALAVLRRLARGEMVLPDVTSGEVPSDGSDLPEATRSAEDRIFTIGRASTDEAGTLDLF
jgi:phage gp36-like protein